MIALDIFSPLQEPQGLRLESTKGPAEVLVADSAERLSDNWLPIIANRTTFTFFRRS